MKCDNLERGHFSFFIFNLVISLLGEIAETLDAYCIR